MGPPGRDGKDGKDGLTTTIVKTEQIVVKKENRKTSLKKRPGKPPSPHSSDSEWNDSNRSKSKEKKNRSVRKRETANLNNCCNKHTNKCNCYED